jgi:glutamyl-tRNA synthetase
MAETDADVAKFEGEGRTGTVRLKMPREGKCEFVDLVRGEMSFDWAREQDTVIQRADGSCTYHLASVVDDYEMLISHVIRAEEHLSNTPRQIFIAQSLGHALPAFAHLPYVAEPGSKSKLSKRKIAKYLKNPDFKKLHEHGEAIAAQIGLTVSADTFNPVLVDFYREVGYLPDAIINYLMLLGWSLDDKTEDFSREQMVDLFSLERVNKAPASFDCSKLSAFQERRMTNLPIKQKVAFCLPFLQRAGLVTNPPPCEVAGILTTVLEAAGDRIKVAGDVLGYSFFFFVSDEEMEFDEKAFQKRIMKNDAWKLLQRYRDALTQQHAFDAASLEKMLKEEFIPREAIQIGDIVHAIRVGITGQPVGPGVFDCLAIVGKESCLRRMERAIERAQMSA